MDEILELARKLGQAISKSDAAKKLRAARDEMSDKPETEKLLEEFQKHNDKLAKLQAENKPIEVEDKQKLQQLHDKLVADETFKKFTAAQVDYVDMMRKVNTAIGEQMDGAEAKES